MKARVPFLISRSSRSQAGINIWPFELKWTERTLLAGVFMNPPTPYRLRERRPTLNGLGDMIPLPITHSNTDVEGRREPNGDTRLSDLDVASLESCWRRPRASNRRCY